MSLRFPIALAVFSILLLSACTPTAAETAEPVETYVSDPSPSESPEALEPNEIEADTTLIVRATATATNGSQLSLELQVHKPTAWDDVAAQTLPAAVVDDCGGLVSLAQFAGEQWSFTRGNLTAIPTAASTSDWPTEAAIGLLPSAASAYLSGRGILTVDTAAGTNLCQQDKSFAGSGSGGFAMGMSADDLTGWAQHRFGFVAPVGTVLSECTVDVTALGASLGGGSGWINVSDAGACVAGPAIERNEY